MFVTLVGAVVVTAVGLCLAQPALLTQILSYSPQNLLCFQRNSYKTPLRLCPAASQALLLQSELALHNWSKLGAVFQDELLGFPADSQPCWFNYLSLGRCFTSPASQRVNKTVQSLIIPLELELGRQPRRIWGSAAWQPPYLKPEERNRGKEK